VFAALPRRAVACGQNWARAGLIGRLNHGPPWRHQRAAQRASGRASQQLRLAWVAGRRPERSGCARAHAASSLGSAGCGAWRGPPGPGWSGRRRDRHG